MEELQALRGEIDRIDAQLTDLFRRRMAVTRQVGEYKLAHGMKVLDAAREAEVLAKKTAQVEEELKADVTTLYESIMAISRRQQRRLVREEDRWFDGLRSDLHSARAPLAAPRVLYQGEEGAYAEQAAADFFGEDCARKHVPAWEDIFLALRAGEADYGVLPIENSSTGSINQVYDLLSKYGAYIVGEQTVRVSHCLLAPPGSTPDTLSQVYSHEQGLLQCEEYLKGRPGWSTHAVANTAAAAKLVAESGDPAMAAIGSRRCAALYGLNVLAEGINSNAENYTRFVVVAPVMELREGRDKISALFTLSHQTGTLYRILTVFAAAGLNMMKLESRPIPGRSWEYRFFVDFTGDLTADGMEGVLRELSQSSETFRVLGNYKANG